MDHPTHTLTGPVNHLAYLGAIIHQFLENYDDSIVLENNPLAPRSDPPNLGFIYILAYPQAYGISFLHLLLFRSASLNMPQRAGLQDGRLPSD